MKVFITCLVSGLALVVVTTSGAVAQTESPGLALVASNVVRLSADTQRSGFTVSKEFLVPQRGVIRVRYQLKHDGATSGSFSVASTLDPSNNCSASATLVYVTKVCDLRVLAGDRVRVNGSGFLNVMPIAQSTVFLRNVRLHWNVVNATSAGEVLVD